MKIEAKKDGEGNIIISEDSFEMLLICLDNQKFVYEPPQNGDSVSVGKDDYFRVQRDIQDSINQYNRSCRNILHQKYIFEVTHNGLSLFKKYEHQDEITPWSGKDVGLVYTLFQDTKINYKKPSNLKPITDEYIKGGDTPLGVDENGWIHVEAKDKPWLIERPLRYDGNYLTISEDGSNNRPWKEEEIEQIQKLFNKK